MIKEVLKNYTQKSRIFLYPLLGIQRNVTIIPSQTYMHWKDLYSISDHKLFCVYKLRDDMEFLKFEESKLLGNKLFHDFKFLEDSFGVYIFEMEGFKNNWKFITSGQYSKISTSHKTRILEFFKNSPHLAHHESFLYPEKYFKLYAELLGIKESVLKEVGELCPKPDFEREELKLTIKNLDILSESKQI